MTTYLTLPGITCVMLAIKIALSCAAFAGSDYEPMKRFEWLTESVWKAEKTDEAGNSVVDIVEWKFILGGRAVQVTHSIDDGLYGGRAIYFYEEENQSYRFHYFTTAGFHTTGTATFEDGLIRLKENVHGHPKIEKVRAVVARQENSIRTESEYLKNGQWVDGHSFSYEKAPGAEVRFAQ